MLLLDDPLAGTPYRKPEPLGSGGMGEVFAAEHAALGRPVVVKLLHRHLGRRRDMADRMRLEGQALGRVSHPNVVAALDLGMTRDGRPYLVMERLCGRTLLAELRDRGPLPAAEAVALAAQALDGLAAVHAAGLCHRDLKPENIFLCDAVPGRERVVKLLDLGVAKVLDAAGGPAPLAIPTAEDVSMGTPRFFSPEQATGKPVDARSDVYAMGVVLYTMVTGAGPFDHLHEVDEILTAHAETSPERPSHAAPAPIAPALEAAILRAMAKRPKDRFPSAAAFAAALRALDLHSSPVRLVPLFLRVLAASFALSTLGTAALRVVLG
jgi:serine/threonine-protein kinase